MLKYEDIRIKPINSSISSMEAVDVSVDLANGNKKMSLPIMARISGANSMDICSAMSEVGVIGIFDNINNIYQNEVSNLKILSSMNMWGIPVFIDDNIKNTLKILELNPTIIEIRSGSGYLSETLKLTEQIKKQCISMGINSLVMSGNVITFDGANNLQSAGADIIRVGNPNGEYFYDKLIDIPQFSALQDCWKVDAMIVSEENGLNFDYFVKALIGGADIYMIKKMFMEEGSDYKKDVTSLVSGYSNSLRGFCAHMNATNIETMRNNSEIMVYEE